MNQITEIQVILHADNGEDVSTVYSRTGTRQGASMEEEALALALEYAKNGKHFTVSSIVM